MKPITIDDFIQNICHECGAECQVLCDQMDFLKNIGDSYKIFSLASNLEIAQSDFLQGEDKEAKGNIPAAMAHYKNAYKRLQKAEKEKKNTIPLPEEKK